MKKTISLFSFLLVSIGLHAQELAPNISGKYTIYQKVTRPNTTNREFLVDRFGVAHNAQNHHPSTSYFTVSSNQRVIGCDLKCKAECSHTGVPFPGTKPCTYSPAGSNQYGFDFNACKGCGSGADGSGTTASFEGYAIVEETINQDALIELKSGSLLNSLEIKLDKGCTDNLVIEMDVIGQFKKEKISIELYNYIQNTSGEVYTYQTGCMGNKVKINILK